MEELAKTHDNTTYIFLMHCEVHGPTANPLSIG